MKLADPDTLAALEAAQQAAKARYGSQLHAAFDAIQALCAGRNPRELTGADAVRLLVLKAEFDAVATAQGQMVGVHLRGLDPSCDW
jgi:hypothetical protein